jgi:hypothetical protein
MAHRVRSQANTPHRRSRSTIVKLCRSSLRGNMRIAGTDAVILGKGVETIWSVSLRKMHELVPASW